MSSLGFAGVENIEDSERVRAHVCMAGSALSSNCAELREDHEVEDNEESVRLGFCTCGVAGETMGGAGVG